MLSTARRSGRRIIPRNYSVQQRMEGLEGIALEGERSGAVRDMASRLVLLARQQVGARGTLPGAIDVAYARLALAAVQATGYVPDPAGDDEWQGVGDTIAHGGDCEDLSTALVAILRAGGLRARLRWLNQPGSRLNHVAVEVFIAGVWRWAEASVAGAQLGENPYDAAARLERGRAALGLTASA